MLSLGVLEFAVLLHLALQMQRDGLGILLRNVFTRYQRFAYASRLQDSQSDRGA